MRAFFLLVLLVLSSLAMPGKLPDELDNEPTPETPTDTSDGGSTPETPTDTSDGGSTPETSTDTSDGGSTPETSTDTSDGGSTPETSTDTSDGGSTPETSTDTSDGGSTPETSTDTSDGGSTPETSTDTSDGGSTPETSTDTSDGGSTPETSTDTSDGGSTPETSTDTSDGGSTPETSTETSTKAPSTTKLPYVNVYYADFSFSCDLEKSCVYEYKLPQNSPQFLATEQSRIDNFNNTFIGDKNNATGLIQAYTNITSTPQTELEALQKSLDEAQQQLDNLNSILDQVEKNQADTQTQINIYQYYVNQIMQDRQSCQYQCLKPTDPSPSPTTPVSTTPSPCTDELMEQCKNTCLVNDQGKPYCSQCPGNLDGSLLCKTSGPGENQKAYYGRFVSPGFDVTNGIRDEHPYEAGTIYSWKLDGNATVTTVNKLSITEPTSLFIKANGVKANIKSENTLKSLFQTYNGPYLITLTIGKVNDNSTEFDFYLEPKEEKFIF